MIVGIDQQRNYKQKIYKSLNQEIVGQAGDTALIKWTK